jgi:hypothetical protein
MSNGQWGPEIVSDWIDQVAAMQKWVALFFADPLTVSDPLSVEVIGPSYARLDPAWVRSSPYALTLDEGFVFRALAPGTSVAAIALMAGAFSSTVIARQLIDPVRSFPTGGSFPVDAGEWTIGIQVPSVT